MEPSPPTRSLWRTAEERPRTLRVNQPAISVEKEIVSDREVHEKVIYLDNVDDEEAVTSTVEVN